MISLGQRIKELRMKMGLTQIELAQGICTPSMISQIESERARPSYKILFALSEKFDVPLEKLLVDVEMNLEYVGTYKMAKAMVASKEYASAIPMLTDVLATPRAVIAKADIQYDLAECFLHTENLKEAESLINEVQDAAVLRQDTQMIAQTYQVLGQIASKRKQFQLAIHLFTKAVDEVNKMEPVDLYLKAGILTHLGSAHETIGFLQDAIHYYSQASRIFENNGTLDEIAKMYMQLGQVYKHLNNLEKATEYSERAISIFEGLENVYTRLKNQVFTANVYGKARRESEAIQMLQQAIQKFQELGKIEEMGTTYADLANVQLKVGQVDDAEESCRVARSLLSEIHVYQAVINRILGEVELRRENREEAIRRFTMAADCFKVHGKVGDWADTMAEISRLKFEAKDAESAYQIIEEVRFQTKQALSERGIML